MLKLILKADKGRYKLGEKPEITVEVTNVSDDPVWVLGVLDGSETGMRYPMYIPKIKLDDKDWEGEIIPICGNLMPFRKEDFTHLMPKETFYPGKSPYLPIVAFNQFKPSVPGEYELILTISTESKSVEEWTGGNKNIEIPMETLKLFRKIPHVKVSASVSLIVE